VLRVPGRAGDLAESRGGRRPGGRWLDARCAAAGRVCLCPGPLQPRQKWS
jgi:hypothetical protein